MVATNTKSAQAGSDESASQLVRLLQTEQRLTHDQLRQIYLSKTFHGIMAYLPTFIQIEHQQALSEMRAMQV